ncbi:hypothetical protein H0Z60_19365 [Ectothiorhodospiraceae bacterium WFHF3C12]|nr:hypothetical protein [Ectothiorhodospiraceae bacterium WFHF3C12]
MSTPHERVYRDGHSDPAPDGWRRRLLAATPADKFIRPSMALEHGSWLHRPRVNEVIDRAFHRHGVVCLSGSPGAGKSVAACQFIDIQGGRGLWYRIGPEDRQPLVVLGSLLHLLQKALPGYRCPPAEALLEADDAAEPQTLVGAVNALLNSAAEHLDEPLYLAMDEFHAMDPASDGGRLLLHAVATLPPALKCLAVARHPLAALRAHVRAERFTEISATALSLTAEETQELCRMFLRSALPGSVCREIHERTLGWVRGVIAVAQALERQLLDEGASANADLLSGPPSADLLELDGYFEHHVVRALDPALRTRLCEICWLDDLSPELVSAALDADDVPGLLSRLFSLGLLIRPGGTSSASQSQLHPLFADFLRRRARRSLPPERPGAILCRAADHLRASGAYEAAIDYLLRAQAYPAAARLLEQQGLQLLADGRFEAVLDRLDRLPINRVADAPWLLLLQGIALLEVHPIQALGPIQQALTGLRAAGDVTGEALCLSQLITYHAGVDGAFFRIPALHQSLEQLLADREEDLDRYARTLANLAIAGARALCDDPASVDTILHECLADAQRAASPNLEVRVRIIRCHRFLQRGELRGAVTELERLAVFLDHPRVGDMARALIHAQQCHYLALVDMPESFSRHRHKYQRASLDGPRRQTLSAPLLCRWACEVTLRRGQWNDAWAELENGLSLGYAAANPNLRSQFLLYRALLLAMQGSVERARLALSEADRFFDQFGTGPFGAQRALLTAAILFFCGEHEPARDWLETAGRAADRTGARYVRAGVHALAARLAMDAEHWTRARDEVTAFLRLMREQHYDCYFLCEPGTMDRVLSFAAEAGIDPETVNRLGQRLLDRAYTGSGGHLPLLRLELLGRIRLRCQTQEVSGDHLARRERTYLATLAGADDQQIDRERLFEAIWPGGAHNSANIYVVRNRLKKNLQHAAPGLAAGDYFKMTGSVVRLENARIDAATYRTLTETGLGHWMRGEHWQAECLFQEADALWRGTFAPTAEDNDLVRDYRLHLHRITEQRVLAWSGLLQQRGAHGEAEAVLERFLEDDPINEEAIKRLYGIRRRQSTGAAAEKALSRYRRQLEAEQFSRDEIERALESIRCGSA